jgi:ATP-dependent RNA helicase DeaD
MNTDLNNILSKLNIPALNRMQESAREQIPQHENTVLLSPTGSGKTLAFLLPVLDRLSRETPGVQCLVIVPSRELGLQIEQVWKKMATEFKVNMCYGGHSIDVETNNLKNPPALLIGTPGRIVDHLERKNFDPSGISCLVLDEFDKSLQLGFHEEMESIIAQLPNLEKRVLVSATSDVEIPTFTGVIKPKMLDFIPIDHENHQLSLKKVVSEDKDKLHTLCQLICALPHENAIVFCNHREAAERISDGLNDFGIMAVHYHGGMDQEERERALIQFRNHSINYLITTDLGARGLDIPEMKHVIHYHLPSTEAEFTHRNGRTARMHATGTAYVLEHFADKPNDFIPDYTEVFSLGQNIKLPPLPDYVTLYISGGKKNKLNKIDIVGFFSQKGGLAKDDLGLIEVKDFISFAAIKSDKVSDLLNQIADHKMKGKKYKIAVARQVRKMDDEANKKRH